MAVLHFLLLLPFLLCSRRLLQQQVHLSPVKQPERGKVVWHFSFSLSLSFLPDMQGISGESEREGCCLASDSSKAQTLDRQLLRISTCICVLSHSSLSQSLAGRLLFVLLSRTREGKRSRYAIHRQLDCIPRGATVKDRRSHPVDPSPSASLVLLFLSPTCMLSRSLGEAESPVWERELEAEGARRRSRDWKHTHTFPWKRDEEEIQEVTRCRFRRSGCRS